MVSRGRRPCGPHWRTRGSCRSRCGARVALLREECELALAGGDGVLVLAPLTASTGAALTDSALEGVGGGCMADLITAAKDRRWAELTGRGARLTVEPRTPRQAEAGGTPGASLAADRLAGVVPVL